MSFLVLLTSCNLFDELEAVAEYGPTPVDLQPKIVLQSLPTKGIEVAAWTPNSDYIITAVGPTRSIAIWEVETGHIIDRLRMPAEPGRTGALLRLSGMEVTPDGNTAVIEGLSARYVREGEYVDPRTMRYELDLKTHTVTIAASDPEPGVDLQEIELAADALEAIFENDEEEFDTLDEAFDELPSLPDSPDGTWTLTRLPVPTELEEDEIPEGGLLLVNTVDGSERELLHSPMQKYDAATLSPTGRWLAMTNDKLDGGGDEEGGLEYSIIEIYDIQTAAFEPQVRILGDYSHIQWLSDDHFVVTETSVRHDGMRDGAPDTGPPPDAVIVNARGGEIELRIEARCYMLAVAEETFVGAGAKTCRAFPQGSYGLQKFDVETDEWVGFGPSELQENPLIDLIAVSPDGSLLAVTEATSADIDDGALVGHIIDAATGELLISRVFEELSFSDMIAFSRDGEDLFVSGNGQIFRWKFESDEWGPMAISSLDTTLLHQHGDLFAVAGEADDAIGLLDFASGKSLPSLHFGNVSSGGFFPDKPLFWAFSAEEGLRLWDTRDWSVVLTTFFFDHQGFLAVTPDGRYDSNVHPYDARFRWLVPDQPNVSLNPDAFSRDYYTPGLTERWIDCTVDDDCDSAFAPIKPLAFLNRDLPKVEIVDVVPGESASEAIVTVEISRPQGSGTDESLPWAYDPRVFRNHQLVFRQSGSANQDGDDLLEWRHSNALASEDADETGTIRLTSVVSLGTSDRPEDQVPVFTAYAFNEDRIKSETAFLDYTRPEVEPRTPRAFVIAIGIDHYQEPRLNLNFAGNDATLMAESLGQIPGHEIRTLSLRTTGTGADTALADPGADTGRVASASAFISPAIISDILAILSQPQAPEARLRLSALGIDASMLEQATPDDLVILSYAGHGWTDSRGEFYLVTSDAVWSEDEGAPDEGGLVSSVDLANWMSAIDAGTMALIIDACHSAASVENGSFKPGPLGDPGLGQLAFDNGVLILTATQADDVALEDANLNHGLLTYVLAGEGLNSEGGEADYDRDKQITLTEWLDYAVERLPAMQSDPRVGGWQRGR
ncbi:WD40 repeat domain-containing protein [Erythrobacter sp. JK5]|uniref:WD40 repeat domain-containing protein n=1 Tax=Erythrobacter sp. JK5 TaxID=2829500 RepID=UPI001BA5B8DF|nr:WD40 repeat domain-containing protein [Erythrobacter sp. JK5]QUL37966.1 WD40 repeat domain-containing protein [Erythrobacter sp. JK5]